MLLTMNWTSLGGKFTSRASSEFSHVPRMTARGTFLQPWSFQLWKGNTRLPSLLLLTSTQNPLIRTSPLNVLYPHALIITPQKLCYFPSIPPCPLFDSSPPSLPTNALAMTLYKRKNVWVSLRSCLNGGVCHLCVDYTNLLSISGSQPVLTQLFCSLPHCTEAEPSMIV